MVNLPSNLELFLEKLQEQSQNSIHNITEKNGVIIIKLQPGVFANYETARPFLATINPLIKRLQLSDYIKMVPLEPKKTKIPTIILHSSVEFHIDLAGIHAQRLKDFFHKDINQKDAENSILFLKNLGLTEKEFLDLGVSRATFYRFKSKSDIHAEDNSVSSETNHISPLKS
jgi:hypothetical protein